MPTKKRGLIVELAVEDEAQPRVSLRLLLWHRDRCSGHHHRVPLAARAGETAARMAALDRGHCWACGQSAYLVHDDKYDYTVCKTAGCPQRGERAWSDKIYYFDAWGNQL